MTQSALTALALCFCGGAIWVRRKTWRIRWDRALTLSFVLQGLGFALCAPAMSHYLEHLGLTITLARASSTVTIAVQASAVVRAAWRNVAFVVLPSLRAVLIVATAVLVELDAVDIRHIRHCYRGRTEGGSPDRY
jgi:hypothetical protein